MRDTILSLILIVLFLIASALYDMVTIQEAIACAETPDLEICKDE